MEKRGFTLVELLVVIAIVGMLSTLALGGYGSYRRESLVDLNADAFVSQLFEIRSKAFRGDFESGRADQIRDSLTNDLVDGFAYDSSDARCFSLNFEFSDGEFEASSRSYEFLNSKVWDIDRWVYKGCLSDEVGVGDLEIDPLVKIAEISYFDDDADEFAVSNTANLRFSPPEAEMKLFVDDTIVNDATILKLLMVYGESQEDRFKREVIIDLNSFTATVNAL